VEELVEQLAESAELLHPVLEGAASSPAAAHPAAAHPAAAGPSR
jgi:hypothetical protein